MKKGYYYLFYKLYKYFEKGPSIWMSDWKAGLTIDVLLTLIGFSLFGYYAIFFNRNFSFSQNGNNIIVILFFCVFLPNYFIFNHKDKWKKVVKHFDKLSRKNNNIGGWAVFLFVLLVLSNFVFVYFLISKIDWSQYQK